ncbi:hypothetical protein CAPTEDRAFT_218761 [Capitella teleta]|uniref:Shisa N-terminal domain-containing protein n=1 Tax=Capitella teleta TaxID=283909 RepID=R7VDD2_CAPTE|nr:hypothetical protein CAPTEDRAFT_218761 [Capitella teleta]|eukprot:ELU16848.1 hypothetical protein CAPTEDRAFT_218761 [Capitella teleta]
MWVSFNRGVDGRSRWRQDVYFHEGRQRVAYNNNIIRRLLPDCFHVVTHKHEYCPGYVDEHGIWNNGFYCPKWGGPDDDYCCKVGFTSYCCAETVATTAASPPPEIATYSIPLFIGVATGAFVLLAFSLITCFLCPCCPAYRKRTPAPSKKDEEVVRGATSIHLPGTPDSTLPRAPPTHRQSALASCPYPHLHRSQSSLSNTCTGTTSSDVQLHCGCHAQWSPTATITRSCGGGQHHQPATQGSTGIPELDQLMLTLYENPATTWQQPDMEQSIEGNLPVDDPPPYTEQSPAEPVKIHLEPCDPPAIKKRPLDSMSPRLCLESFRPLHQRKNNPSPLPPALLNYQDHLENQRRDSGVLVDDLEPQSEPFLPVPMPLATSHDHVLASIREGRRSPYDNADFESTFMKS